MNLFLTILLQTTNANGGGMSLILLLLIFVVFYFFMIRPQQKRQKKVEEFRKSLQKGDMITTVGGVLGKIKEIKDTTFIIEIAHDVCVEILKAAVTIDESLLENKKKEEKEKK